MSDPRLSSALGTPPRRPLLRRLAPVVVLAAGFVLFFALGLDRYASFEALRDNRAALKDFVAGNGALALLAYAALYAVVVAFSVPGAAVLTIAGGFLFGTWLGGAVTVVGATLGATAVFLIARSAFGDALRARAGPLARRLEAGFRENALSYLLFLRLIPLFPFWLVNLVPAFAGVSTGTYVLGTALGIVPGTFVFASVGNGVGAIFDAGGVPDLSIVFAPEVVGPLVALAVLSLVPVVYKKVRARRAGPADPGPGMPE